MKTFYNYFGEAILWSLTFGFYFVCLYFMFETLEPARPVKITVGLLAGSLITRTYFMWSESWWDYKSRRRNKKDL